MLLAFKMVYSHELKFMTEKILAIKKRKEVLDDFKARALARAEKNDAAKAEAKAKKES